MFASVFHNLKSFNTPLAPGTSTLRMCKGRDPGVSKMDRKRFFPKKHREPQGMGKWHFSVVTSHFLSV